MPASKVNTRRITTTVYLVLTAAVISVGPATNSRASAESIELPHVEISNWAIRFGAQMWEIGKQVTRIREIRERYQSEAKIDKVDGLALVKEMSEELENMMGDKIEAIKRIMDASEQLSMPHNQEVFERGQRVDYYNAKRLNEYQKSGANTGELMKEHKALMMTNSRHYGNVGINTSVSAVHVPTNVFDGGPDVMNGIVWSEQLDRIFISNYESDPSLTWQFFGSSTGFMRQFPATKWGQGEWEPDLYDCRLRPWYLQAASSPKDMIILVDTSGSMTGVRKEIAKHVVLTLLDTLSENDFINIYKFSETPIPVVPCFKDKLVHANLENLRELRHGMIETETSDIANFTLAFTAAFEILAKYNRTNQGTQCNQAIMLVTDGAPSGYREVFEKFNWPHKPVRVFSYVIGREIIDTTATNWMACTNKGYFARVTSLAEVREQVLKYIPVLSRPMVMYQKEHPIVWTSSYVDVAEPKLSDWLWEIRERRKQRERSLNYRALLRLMSEKNNPSEEGGLFGGGGSSSPTNHSESGGILRPVVNVSVEQYLQFGNHLTEERMNAHRARLEREEATHAGQKGARGHPHYQQSGNNRLSSSTANAIPDNANNNIPFPSEDDVDDLDHNDLRIEGLIHRRYKRDSIIQTRTGQDEKNGPRAEALIHPNVLKAWLKRIESRTKPKYRMVISVATPVYDRKNFTVRTANLLGVAGTDIPVAEVKKRTPAYKLGVNGYAFMVNNNGFVVFHPDHRPLDQDEILKPNYNSVDLSEVELVDSDAGPRDNDTTLMTMRREMIEKKESETMMRVKIHYDGMRRASIRRQRYYYRGLKGTPFSLGLALPEGYGHFRVVAETEVKRLMADHNINVSSFFSGKNWKVHPNWVYCRYNYDTLKTFDTPEAEVLHFVDRTQRERWRWNSKHPRPSPDSSRSHKQDDNYYCDKHLMQSLIFDAQATGVFDKNISQSLDKQDPHAMFKLFGISVAFVATRSGLVRWQDINTIDDNLHVRRRREHQRRHKRAPSRRSKVRKRFKKLLAPDQIIRLTVPVYKSKPRYARHFSETNIHAIDQTWYKRAVDQYLVEPESFVYSVPFGVSPGMVNETVVTASHAIFVEKDGYRAPAAVVGLQYKNSAFRETFFNITSGCTGGMPCKRTCGDSGDLACYVLDNNGYVVISKEERDMSRFFGEIDWLVMDSLIHYGVFKKIRVYDYQAVCKDQIGHKSAANFLLTPFRYAKWIVHWMMGRASWMLLQTQLAHWINPDWAWSMEQQEESEYQEEGDANTEETPSASPGEVVDGEISINQQDEPVTMENAYANKTRQRPCDRQTDLYTLQPEKLFKGGKADSVKGKHNCNSNSFSTRQCERHYSTHKIPHSNLLLVVIDTSCKCDTQKRRIDSEEVKLNNETDVCNRPQDNLFRLRPTTCISYHPEEEEIKQCGGASLALPSLLLAVISLLFSIFRSV